MEVGIKYLNDPFGLDKLNRSERNQVMGLHFRDIKIAQEINKNATLKTKDGAKNYCQPAKNAKTVHSSMDRRYKEMRKLMAAGHTKAEALAIMDGTPA